LVALVIAVHHYRPKALTATLVCGTVMVLAFQGTWFPGNFDVARWMFQHNIAALRAQFAHRTQDNTLTVGDALVSPPPDIGKPYPLWDDVLYGNHNQVAGMHSLGSYSGMGYRKFSQALCMHYDGGTCPQAYDLAFARNPETGQPLADLLRLRTVVVVNGFLPDGKSVTTPPEGWIISRKTALTTTVRRVSPLPQLGGRISWFAPTVAITSDQVVGAREERIRYLGGGTMLVATLAWPGYHATVNGQPVAVHEGPAGLVELQLPPHTNEATVRLWFRPARLRAGAALAGLGLALGGGYCLVYTLRLRRRFDAQEAG
jgi:hypothetical protein